MGRLSVALSRACPSFILFTRNRSKRVPHACACVSPCFPEPGELALGFDPTSVFNTPELEYLGNGDAFSQFDGEFFPNFSDSGSGGLPWASDGLDFRSVDDMLGQYSSDSSPSSLHNSSPGPSMNWWENDVFCENKQMLYACFRAGPTRCIKLTFVVCRIGLTSSSHIDISVLLTCTLDASKPR